MQFVLVLSPWCHTGVKQAWLGDSFLCWHFLHFNKQGRGAQGLERRRCRSLEAVQGTCVASHFHYGQVKYLPLEAHSSKMQGMMSHLHWPQF